MGHNGKPNADRIADYLDSKAQRFLDRAGRTRDTDLRARATPIYGHARRR